SQRARRADAAEVDALVAASEERAAAITRFENLRAQQKAFGKRVATAQGEEKQELLAEVKQLAEEVKAAEAASVEAQQSLRRRHAAFPNLIHEGVPAGGEEDFAVLRTEGAPRDFVAEGFTPKDHLEL